jgi:nucleotide-binding universal stress UspA family protein
VIVSADPFFLSRRDQIVALAAHYAVLVNPDSPNAEPDIEDARRAARVLGWQIAVVTATTEREFDVWPGFAPRAALQRTAAGTRFLLI